MKHICIEPLEARIAPAVLTLAGAVSVDEGNLGQTDLVFKVLLDEASPTPLTVKVNTVDGTATVADGDYTALTDFTVSIPANVTEKTFVVKVTGDTKFEADETFSVVLSSPSAGHSLGAATSAVGTIRTEPDAVPKVSVNASTAVEKNIGAQQIKFVVSLSNPSSEAVTFNWNTNDLLPGPTSATAGSDYTAVVGGTATIPAGQTSVEIAVDITPDLVKEASELFEVVLTNPLMGATALEFVTGKDRANGTIANDEPDVAIDFAAGQNPRPNEGSGGGETTVNLTLKLVDAAGSALAASQDVEVFLSTVDGFAVAGSDFVAMTNQRFVVQAGQLSITVPVKIVADSIFETEEYFSVQIDDVRMNGGSIVYDATTNPTGVLVKNSPLRVTIVNDEATPTLSLTPSTTVEPATGTKVMNFTVQMSGAVDRDVQFTWKTTQLIDANAAFAGLDYTDVAATQVTIPAGQTTFSLPVTILNDALTGEGNEQFRVELSAPTIVSLAAGGSQALGTIRANPLTISVVPPTAATEEGTTGADRDALFRISRAAGDSLAEAVTVRVSTVDGTATVANGDYTALTNATFTIPAGIQDIVVPVKVKPDNRKEADESFSLRIDSLSISGATFDGIGTQTGSATITDDDAEPTLSIGDASVSEGNSGTKKLTFTVTLSNAADTDVTFQYVTALDTGANAASGADFTEVTSLTTVTIPAGSTSKTVELDITGDIIKETAETFSVQISNALRGATALTITDATGVMTITDDEPVVSIIAPGAQAEGSTAGGKTNITFTVNLDKSAPENIAVRVSTVDGTAAAGLDYEAVGVATEKWIIIPAGSRSATVSVPVLHDTIAEIAETFSVRVDDVKVGVGATLDSNGLPTGGTTLPQEPITPAVATITDDDALSLSINDVTIVEGNSGTSTMTFTVSLPRVASRDVTFDFSTANNTAVSGVDFTAITGAQGTIPAGSTSVTLTVDILGDATNEADETFTVVLSNAKVGTDTLTVADEFGAGKILNDEQTVSINSSLSIVENAPGGLAVMTVTLSSAAAAEVRVDISLTNGTAAKGQDFSDPASLTVIIPAGQTTATISVPVTADANFEADETFDVYLIGSTNAQLGAVTRGTVTITNDDISSKLSVTNVSVAEGTGGTDANPQFTDMTFTVTLDQPSGAPITFDWQTLTGPGFTATGGNNPGDDFTPVALQTVTIPSNALSQTFTVKIRRDAIHESNETVGVQISNVLGGELASPDTVGGMVKSVTGTIINDESVPSLTISDTRLIEGESGVQKMKFTVSIDRKADRDVTFRYATLDDVSGTSRATADVDYVSIPLTAPITIPAGSTFVEFEVDIIGDTLLEADETFLVEVSNAKIGNDPLAVSTLRAKGTIRRDEITATVQSAVTGAEADGLVDVLIPVTLSQAVPVGESITVGYELISGSGVSGALSGVDFDVPAVQTITFAAGEITKNIVIKVRPDNISELSETFTLKLKDSTSQNVAVVSGAGDTSTVTIDDNDAAPVVTITNVGGSEASGTLQFTIKLSNPSSRTVSVQAETVDGTAISTPPLFDFTGRALETIEFAPGDSLTKTYTVSVRNDSDPSEGIENFTVRLSNPTNAVFENSAVTIEGTGTIADPDIASIRITNASVLEGNNSGTPAKLVFTVAKTGNTSKEITADYTISFDALLAAGVTAAAADDIVSALTGTVTIPASQSSAVIEISLNGDTVAEGDQAFRISLGNFTNTYVLADSDKSAVGTILEDDVQVRLRDGANNARPAVISQAEGNTGTSNIAFAVDLNQIATRDVVVTFTVTAGTAEAGVDFNVPTTLTLTIPAGQTTATLLVPIIGDTDAEGAETFTVAIDSVTGGFADSANQSRTGEITNDDATFRVLDGARVVEGNSGTSNLVFQIELVDAVFVPGTEYSVDYTTENITAIGGQDYTTTSGSLTFTANGILTVTVPVTGDTASENDETLRLRISNSKVNTTAVNAILGDEATGTIQDDEFNLSIGSALVTEGDAGQQQMIFVLSMPLAAPHPVVVNYITVDGTAVGAAPGATDLTGKDFRAITSGSVTIPAGQLTAQIPVTVFGDLVDEPGGETFIVRITSVSGALAVVSEGTGTIAEDADPLPTLSIADAQVLEGNAGTPVVRFRVLLTEAANADVTFKWNTTAGTAFATDFTPQVDQTATILKGAKFIDIDVPVTPDALVEGSEKFTVAISEAKRGTTVLTISDDTATGTILDDDGTLRVKTGESAVTFAEGAGKARVNFEVEPIAGEFSVTYTVTQPGGTGDVAANAGTDFTVPTSLTKTFAAGTAASDLFLEFDITDDQIDEWDEKFVITLTGVSGVKLDSNQTNLRSEVTITDDDAAPELQIADIIVQESSASAQFIVKLTGNVTERNITIKWDALSDTALAGTDFTNLTGQTLSIPAGQREGTISVGLINDTLDEADEKFRVALLEANFTRGAVTGDELVFAGGKRNGIATIAQNDLRSATVTGGSVVEGSTGTTTLNFTIRLDAAPSSTPVKVNYTTIAGTAFATEDFTSTSGQVIFNPGETSKTVAVTVVSDDIAELDETLKLQISIPADGFAVLSGNSEATGTIEADESTFRIERVLADGESVELTEGARAKFKVVRIGVGSFLNFPATVSYAALEDATAGTLRAISGTDFVPKTGSITFAANQSDSSAFGQFIEVDAINDSVAELNGEKFIVRLTNVINGVVSSTDGEKQLIINDNDVPPDPKVRIEDARIAEGGSLSFTVKLVTAAGVSTTAAYPIRLSYSTLLGAAGAGVATADDFTAAFSESLKTIDFATGQSQITITVPTAVDAIAEQDETMIVRLSKLEKNLGGFTEITNAFLPQGSTTAAATIDATGTIRNDDTVITVNPVAQPEGNAATSDMTFVASIPAAAAFAVTFHYKTKTGTANASDFNAAEGDVTIPAGQTQASFVVQIKGDTIRENTESFSVDLTAATNAVLSGASPTGTATITGTIQNDDAGPQLTIAAGQVAEGAAGNANAELIFTVTLLGEITQNVSVNFATSDGSASASGIIQDYIAQNGVLTFNPIVGNAFQTREIKVKVIGDNWKEGDETVNVALTNATGDAQIIAGSATGTILDESDSTIGVFIKDTSAVEGANAVFTVELTSLGTGNITLKANTRSGSADATDFNVQDNRAVTINSATSKTATISVPTRSDSVFEPTETFRIDLSDISDGAAFIPGSASAQAVIYNDDQRIINAREFEFIDEDGDLVNVKVSKGSLFKPNAFGVLQSRGIVTLADAGSVGGKSISSINFLGTGREFEGANVTVSRKVQAGFDKATDGRVNVAEIISAQEGFASLVQGVNLGTVKVDGDLGKIVAGSTLRPNSIGKLDVGSLGVVDRTANGATQSILFGAMGSLLIRGDMEGTMFVVGSTVNMSTGVTTGLGKVGSITIKGKLIGGADEGSAFISTNASIGKITVGGIVGGAGKDSAKIQAGTSIGSFTALGDIVGGSGISSALVVGTSIGKVEFGAAARRGVPAIEASIIGGAGGPDTTLQSNQILSQVGSGAVVSFSSIGSVKMIGDIRGGDGEQSGLIFANGNIGKLVIDDITGGSGEESGRVRLAGSIGALTADTIQGGDATRAGSIEANGRIGSIKLGNLLGTTGVSSSASEVEFSGSISAGEIGKVLVTGSLKASTATGADQFASGAIISDGSIASLTVKGAFEGSVVDSSVRAATVFAGANIGKVSVNTMRFAEILSGYTAGGSARGSLNNADSKIGIVEINDFAKSSIVAGVDSGNDESFGTADDNVPVVGVTNVASVISKIARVTIKNVLSDGDSSVHGISAQSIGPVKVAGVAVAFGADIPKEILPGAGVFINVA